MNWVRIQLVDGSTIWMKLENLPPGATRNDIITHVFQLSGQRFFESEVNNVEVFDNIPEGQTPAGVLPIITPLGEGTTPSDIGPIGDVSFQPNVEDVEKLFESPELTYRAGLGLLGQSYFNPYEQFQLRNEDQFRILHERLGNLAFENVPGYSTPTGRPGEFVRGSTPADLRALARQQLQTAFSLDPASRSQVGLQYGGGAIPTLLQEGTRGRLAPTAAQYLANKLPLERTMFAATPEGAGGGGDFLAYLKNKYDLGRFF